MLQPDNILVIRLSSLGDVLMCLPAVKAIGDSNPAAHISWLVEGSVGEFLSHQTFINEVIRFPRGQLQNALKGSNVAGTVREMRGFMHRLRAREYDTVLDFHGIAKSVLLSFCARGDARRIGFDRVFAKEQSHLFYHDKVSYHDRRIHKVERNMLIARRLGVDGTAPDIRLTVSQATETYIDTYISSSSVEMPFIAINPFSSRGSEFKRWGIEKYAQLARKIRAATGKTVLVLWGPGEKTEAEALVAKAGNGVFLSCSTNISQLFALLKKARMYIGGDTGVMHLATFAGVPVAAIFGPTDPLINGPYGLNHTVIRHEVACSPCKNKSCLTRRCVEEITVEEVYNMAISAYGWIDE